MGVELADDPGFKARVASGQITEKSEQSSAAGAAANAGAMNAVWIFGVAVIGIVILGLFPDLRPSFATDAGSSRLAMASTIEIVMLTCAGLIMLLCGAKSEAIVGSSVMRAGIVAVISILGIAWMGSTFFEAFEKEVVAQISDAIAVRPWVFSVGLFALSILLYSQAATVAALQGIYHASQNRPFWTQTQV